jgi:tetratricopeptide (TPR) repeat protein
MIAGLLTLALLAAPAQSSGYYTDQEAHALFEQGNQAFAKEDYEAARADFEKLLAHGFGGADVHYNLGTVALAQGDLGQAVLHLERAKREGGATGDVLANLALARSRQLDKVVGAQPEGSVSTAIAQQTPTTWVGAIFLFAWGLGFLLLIARRFLSGRSRAWSAVLAGAAGVLALISGSFLAYQAHVLHDEIDAVVLDKTVAAHELPDDASKVAFEVHAGLEVRVGDEEAGFVRIQLPNGLVGWAPKSAVEQI